MSQYRVVRLLVAMGTLAGLATGGCSDDKDDDGTDGGAVMKFCNELFAVDAAGVQTEAELTVIFAGVKATALSGTCTPVVPNACIPVPAGENPTVVLQDPSTNPAMEIISGTFPTLTVLDGDELFVVATIDDVALTPTVTAGTFDADFACADTDPFAVMLETKSAPFDVRAQHSLRTQQNPAATRWMRKAIPGLGR
ncbi:MAG TPA: hypothetical protein VMS65_17170 [Polyangiaceae bacterium]|nr:hypothetical protein [Polyangiaceae bacterium]